MSEREVLISIQPKWVDKIASGEKTIEVRKTKPNLQTPFKCYIYETQSIYKTRLLGLNCRCQGRGKVIGEFVCDNILHSNENAFIGNKPLTQYVLKSSCLTMEEINQYRQGKNIYAWHISDLKIYDKPKELSEFYGFCKCKSCMVSGYESSACIFDEDCKVPKQITRPPQSWCYVEPLKEKTDD